MGARPFARLQFETKCHRTAKGRLHGAFQNFEKSLACKSTLAKTIAGMSRSTLTTSHFRAITAMSPLQISKSSFACMRAGKTHMLNGVNGNGAKCGCAFEGLATKQPESIQFGVTKGVSVAGPPIRRSQGTCEDGSSWPGSYGLTAELLGGAMGSRWFSTVRNALVALGRSFEDDF